MPDTQTNEAFLEFLKNTPTALADLLSVIKRFLEETTSAPTPGVSTEPGPRTWEEGAQHVLTTVGISQADIDKLTEEAAEADVIERLIAFVKGFITGVLIVTGPLGGAASEAAGTAASAGVAAAASDCSTCPSTT